MNRSMLIAAGAAVAVGAALIYISRKGALGTGQAIGQAIGDGAAGVVVGLGETIGIPATDADRCRRAMAEGNGLDASLYCPAPDYLRWELSGRPKP